MDESEIIKSFYSALPALRHWIDDLLATYYPESTPVSLQGFQKIPRYFPGPLLEETRVATVAKVPFPPLGQFGLDAFSDMEQMPIVGITYNDTFFVHERHRTESLFFHELVHVVQWKRLGVEPFLLAYGAGLLQFGYENSPLEQMAYDLQRAFDQGHVPENLMGVIHHQTDAIWQQVEPLFDQ